MAEALRRAALRLWKSCGEGRQPELITRGRLCLPAPALIIVSCGSHCSASLPNALLYGFRPSACRYTFTCRMTYDSARGILPRLLAPNASVVQVRLLRPPWRSPKHRWPRVAVAASASSLGGRGIKTPRRDMRETRRRLPTEVETSWFSGDGEQTSRASARQGHGQRATRLRIRLVQAC